MEKEENETKTFNLLKLYKNQFIIHSKMIDLLEDRLKTLEKEKEDIIRKPYYKELWGLGILISGIIGLMVNVDNNMRFIFGLIILGLIMINNIKIKFQ